MRGIPRGDGPYNASNSETRPIQLQASSRGLQRDSKISISRTLPSAPEATDRTMSASLFWVEGWLPVVHQQEGDRRICADPFVAVEERVILAKVKEVRRCHRGNGGVQEFAAECCPGRGYGRFKSGSVAESRGPPRIARSVGRGSPELHPATETPVPAGLPEELIPLTYGTPLHIACATTPGRLRTFSAGLRPSPVR